MKTAQYQMPDGSIVEFQVDDHISAEEAQNMFLSHQAAQASGLAPTDKAAPAVPTPEGRAAENAKFRKTLNATDGMSTGDKVLAGAGQSFHDAGVGAQQFHERFSEDPTRLGELQAQAAEDRALTEDLGNTKAGIGGKILGGAAVTAPLALAAAPATLGGAMVAGGAGGLATSLIKPRTKDEGMSSDLAVDTALSALIPGGGATARSLVGNNSPIRREAADALKAIGINISKSDVGGGGLNQMANAILNHAPIASTVREGGNATNRELVRKSVFGAMGADVPYDNAQMRELITNAGENVGAIGSQVPRVSAVGLDDAADAAFKRGYADLPSHSQNREAINWLGTMSDKGSKAFGPPAPITGSASQAMRRELGRLGSSAEGAHAGVFKDLRDAIDTNVLESATPEVREAIGVAKKNYALADALRNVDVKEGGDIDLGAMRRAITRKARAGAPLPEGVERTLSAAELLIPKPHSASQALKTGATWMSLLHPAEMTRIIGIPAAIKGTLNTGIPQYLSNNPEARAAIAQGLRGGIFQRDTEN